MIQSYKKCNERILGKIIYLKGNETMHIIWIPNKYLLNTPILDKYLLNTPLADSFRIEIIQGILTNKYNIVNDMGANGWQSFLAIYCNMMKSLLTNLILN